MSILEPTWLGDAGVVVDGLNRDATLLRHVHHVGEFLHALHVLHGQIEESANVRGRTRPRTINKLFFNLFYLMIMRKPALNDMRRPFSSGTTRNRASVAASGLNVTPVGIASQESR